MKSKYLDKILDVVSSETEVEKDLILSTNKCIEVVDARALFCYFAYMATGSKKAVARYMSCTPERVGYLVSTFESRRNIHIFQIFYQKIKRNLFDFKEKETEEA